MPCEVSVEVSTASPNIGSVKLGQPEPDSNLVSELNRALPQPGAAIHAVALLVDVLARPRALGGLVAQDLVGGGIELLAPLLSVF